MDEKINAKKKGKRLLSAQNKRSQELDHPKKVIKNKSKLALPDI